MKDEHLEEIRIGDRVVRREYGHIEYIGTVVAKTKSMYQVKVDGIFGGHRWDAHPYFEKILTLTNPPTHE